MPRRPAATGSPSLARETRSTGSQRQREAIPVDLGGGTSVPSTPSKRRRTSDPADLQPAPGARESREGGSGSPADHHDADAKDEQVPPAAVLSTPALRRRGRPPRASATPANRSETSVARPTHARSPDKNKNPYETPVREDVVNGTRTPGRRTITDRSARRKSARALIARLVAGATSDDDAGDEGLVREIYESSEDEETAEVADGGTTDAAATPSCTQNRRDGKKKTLGRKKKSPTPPRDLPANELYLFQNRPGLTKTSNNSLASLHLLTHDEYFSITRSRRNPHEADTRFLEDVYAESFSQWTFELAEGFSLCLYGYGSKRPLLHRFAGHLHRQLADQESHKILVINGYVRTITIREMLAAVGTAVEPSYKLSAGTPVALLQGVLSLLVATDVTVVIILNSADAPPLRKPSFQTILSQLAAHPHIHLACSVDTPDFAFLWDTGQRSLFNFAFHDCTTFAPRSTAELNVVDDVHELLGRKARRVGGKDGVAFVLKSLPENAKSLFRMLVGEVLSAMEEAGVGAGGENPGVEYRMVYNKAVEEFICSSEMAFRTLLKEFHDHQMITSRKDVLGTELLSLPFRREELEAILEDLM